jgi:hypothetical protein
MYYEARVHELIEVISAEAAAGLIRSDKMYAYQVPCWNSQNGLYKMYAVPDGHIDNPFLEIAILRKPSSDENAPLMQVESITNGWIRSTNALAIYLQDAEKSDIVMNSNATLIVGNPKGDEQANFTCGCCGNWFSGNVQEQLKFNQDAGYGICNGCKKWYT